MTAMNTIIDIAWPDIEGLSVRMFRGSEDFPGMISVFDASKAVDDQKFVWTVEDMERDYKYPINFVPVGGTAYSTYRNGSSILRGAAATASVAAGTTAATEAALHLTQIERKSKMILKNQIIIFL